jgi:glycosyltransferase involved in cell wall biosynthesis
MSGRQSAAAPFSGLPGGEAPMNVSIVVIAKNEARNIRRCLESLAGFEDVVVIDDDSSDETPIIASSLGARVICHRFESFAAQRNWALEHVRLQKDWVLMLDADESLTPAVCEAIGSATMRAAPSLAGFLMCRRNWFLNRFLRFADGYPVWIMRLVRRGRARFVDSGHGEVPAPPVDGILGKIKEPFLHYPFSHGLSQWVTRHNVYSTREAQLELAGPPGWHWRESFCGSRQERRSTLRNIARNLPARPLLRFFHNYLWNWGVLDGRAGLAFSLLMAWYEGMIVLKRWESQLPMESPTPRDSLPSSKQPVEPGR